MKQKRNQVEEDEEVARSQRMRGCLSQASSPLLSNPTQTKHHGHTGREDKRQEIAEELEKKQ